MRRGTPFSSVSSSLSLFFVFLSSLLPAVLFPQFHWILKKYINTTITGPQSAPQGWLSWVACTHKTHRRAYTQTQADAGTNTLTQTHPVSEPPLCGKDTTIAEYLFAVECDDSVQLVVVVLLLLCIYWQLANNSPLQIEKVAHLQQG